MPQASSVEGAFDLLYHECECRGWELLIGRTRRKDKKLTGVIVVETPDRFTRTVEKNESYDKAAWVVLRSLRKSKVL